MTTLSVTKRPGRSWVMAHPVPTTAELVAGLALRVTVLAVTVAVSALW
jgi:hypothetical protein